ncbi:flagellar basal body rod protein FlgC [Desulfotalea psychrophila]|uniref:Flagellar basal-body rod protein FlgC n=1 Tax=Desulfotalea psychrophila (strain LSv54 / DSM 12343) TaxID=177439 RepID=Q6AJU3_DESPS|nr:flagellar basal body rod protein FlgC [Desulfotalea psychrophila]CAG37383.1 probable flagellar basal body rod protein (FlgC) [Desulfotalea psychrophila LSv54]
MDILNSFKISSSALKAQSIRLDTISSNIANAETTSTPEGGPYKKKSVYFQAKPLTFAEQLNGSLNAKTTGVEVINIIEDKSEPRKVYDPSHPDAGKDGYVDMPNVDTLKEMVDMMSATRSYQANVTAIQSAKRMALKALEIGR